MSNAELKGLIEPQHVLMLDALFKDGLGIVAQKVVFHHGVHAKTKPLIIGQLVVKCPRAQLDARDALVG